MAKKCEVDNCQEEITLPENPDVVQKRGNEMTPGKYKERKEDYERVKKYRRYCDNHRCPASDWSWKDCENQKLDGRAVCDEHVKECSAKGLTYNCQTEVEWPNEYCDQHRCRSTGCKNGKLNKLRVCQKHSKKCSLGDCQARVEDPARYCSLKHECSRQGCHLARLVDPQAAKPDILFCRNHYEEGIRHRQE